MIVEPADLERICKQVADILGSEFINEMKMVNLNGFPQSTGVKRENRDQLAECARQKLIAHPLAHWLQKFDMEAAKSVAVGGLQFSETSHRFLHFAANLIAGGSAKNFELVIPRLKQRSEFHSAAYELEVAAKYLALGYEVQFVPVMVNQMTPDLVITMNGASVQVECKSSKYEEDEQHNFFMQLAVRLDAAIEGLRENLSLTISPKLKISGRHVERLANELIAEIPKVERREQFLGGVVSVEWQKTDPDVVIVQTAPDDMQTVSDFLRSRKGPSTDSAYVSLTSMINAEGRANWKQGCALEIKNYFEVDIFHSLKGKIKKACRQLSSDQPAIIHIQVPCKSVRTFLSVIDENFERLFALVKEQNKVRAVVLECATINWSIRDGDNPIASLCYVISDPEAKCALPEDLRIGGTTDMGIRVALTSGTLAFPFKKPADPSILHFRPLFFHSTPHGDEQIILWATNNNTFRFEVISAKIGRLVIEEAVDWLELPDEFEVLVSWGTDSRFLRVGPPVRDRLGPWDYAIR